MPKNGFKMTVPWDKMRFDHNKLAAGGRVNNNNTCKII